MAMTIKQKVSFEVTNVVPTDVLDDFEKELLAQLKSFHKGEKLNGFQRHICATFLKMGLEAAITETLSHQIKSEVKYAFDEFTVNKLSPVVVRNV